MSQLTIEEVNKVANKHTSAPIPDSVNLLDLYRFTPEELLAFAQHYKEEGRKEQRESDAKLCESRKFMVLLPLHTRTATENCSDMKLLAKQLAESIRNNTGA